jgi:D-alanyl-D-alanine carboxypeptidase
MVFSPILVCASGIVGLCSNTSQLGAAEMFSKIHRELGIRSSYGYDTGMPVYPEPDDLVSIGLDIYGRPQRLARVAAEHWDSLRTAASTDGIKLYVVSVFRSVDYQASLIRKKLRAGQSIEDIIRTNAAPGHSEHHSGRALDLTTKGCEPLCEVFEKTPAFQWLTGNAPGYGFSMTYSRQNEWGIDFEPWHWCCGRA